MTTVNLEFLLEQQLTIYGHIARSVENLRRVAPDKITQQRAKGRLEQLRVNWEKFRANDDKICAAKTNLSAESHAKVATLPYFKENVYEICQEKFLDSQEEMTITLDDIAQKEGTLKSQTPQTHGDALETERNATHSRFRLPQIELPKFSGDYAEWVPFRDLFTSLIRTNAALSPVEKLQYLKTSLTGTAALRLKNVSLTADNYQVAWDDLVSYFENKRVLVDAALNSLFSAKTITRETASDIEQLHSEIRQALGSLAALGRAVQHWDDILVYTTVRKLDSTSVKYWERELGASSEPPTWERLEMFLVSRIRALQAVERATGKSRTSTQTSSASKQSGAKSHHTAAATRSQTCSLCNSTHYISSCPTYVSKSTEQRLEIVAQKKLCYNCLGPHQVKVCRSSKRCRSCGAQHHTTIHRENLRTSTAGTAETQQATTTAAPTAPGASQARRDQQTTSTSASVNVALSDSLRRTPVLLATAVVNVVSRYGELLEARALLDQGSEISLVTESLAQRLRLPRSRSSTPIIGIGAESSRPSHGSIILNLHSRNKPQFECKVNASVLPKLTGYLPSVKVSDHPWPYLQDLQLADPNFAQPGRIDLVLGADIYGHLLEEGLRKGPADAPIAQQTALGWILSGTVLAASSQSTLNRVQSFQCSPDNTLLNLLQKFWLQEEVFSRDQNKLSNDEAPCEEHFSKTHSRNSEGRYIVRLPFKRSPENLGDSYTPALRVLDRLEKSFFRDETLRDAYSKFMEEYESLGHMRRVRDLSPSANPVFYLPHLCVFRESSSSTKYRVVFNGSQQTDRAISLNDCLHEGQKLTTDLADVVTRWRAFEFAFSADVSKMFRQILVHEKDQDLQRILWRTQRGELVEYALCTVTYGLTSAPFLANRTLRQLALDEGPLFPLAEKVIEESTYVDDVFSGADSLQEGKEKVRQVANLFNAGGFPLKKWIANRDELLESIPEVDRESSPSLSLDEGPSYRTLGLTWQQRTDRFVFTLTDTTKPAITTKRVVLSRTAQLFDPLGWLAPVIVRAKIFMQDLWAAQLGWDEPLPPHLESRWKEYAQQLPDVSQISVPRWLGLSPTAQGVEIHGFSDASHAALGAVIYVRVLHEHLGEASITLISAKSKVAPIKKESKSGARSRNTVVTTPRLELSAAVLLTRLLLWTRQGLKLEEAPVHLWTDSSTTLYWIQGNPSRWKDFVRNRVTQIQELLPDARWHHVPGEDNPADLASRGVSPNQLAGNPLWWHGPAWLAQHSTFWPSLTPEITEDDLEERQQTIAHASINTAPVEWELVNRYSRLSRLLRITAWCLRAVARFRHKEVSAHSSALTPDELDNARLFWVKSTQDSYFAREKHLISRGIPLPRANALIRLVPFLDSDGLLRVSGRLHNALLDHDMKHPLILPPNAPFTKLVLDQVHRSTLHGGTQIMNATLRRMYWIVGGRTPVRSFVLRCVTCSRQRAVTASQLMGQLPISRTLPTRPFLHAGVDYAGPFTLKTWRGRAAKTYKDYLIVFVCFSSSAVHLELATDYSTEGFLAAFKRFTGRRGICATLTSDCGTNLVGADAELRRLFASSSKELESLANLLANDGTKWSFNPSAAPHFGGKWEAAVKSVKFHLKRVVGEALLTYEEFHTLLIQIEAVLNSRPICPLTDDPSDIEALTPGHFLVGNAINSIPEPSLVNLPKSRLSRWQLLRQLLEKFWQRWSTEYLQRFQGMSKWHQKSDSIRVGSLVLFADERYPPTKWQLARVIAVHPGKDGYVRVATVRTQTTTLERPIVKLCVLPVSTSTP